MKKLLLERFEQLIQDQKDFHATINRQMNEIAKLKNLLDEVYVNIYFETAHERFVMLTTQEFINKLKSVLGK